LKNGDQSKNENFNRKKKQEIKVLLYLKSKKTIDRKTRLGQTYCSNMVLKKKNLEIEKLRKNH